MSISQYIKTLSLLNGISGFEHNVSDFVANHFKGKGFEVTTDSMGNVIACKKLGEGHGKVMLEAHVDEIGMLVKSIDKNGFLFLSPVGGFDPRILPASEVVVHGKKDYLGIVGAKPPHMMSADEYSKTLDFAQLYVDVGMTKEQADDQIGIGAYVTFKGEYCKLHGDYVASKAMDDRASLAVLLDCADKLADASLGYDLYICACVQEEVGMRGALTAAYAINPDLAIAIDVTHATTPDESKGTFKCGCGPVVCLGPNIHNALVNHFIDILKREGVSYEIEVEGGNTGTDAWSIQTAREGIPTMLLSLALKYMHTPIETLSLADCVQTSDALVSFLKSFEKTEDVLC